MNTSTDRALRVVAETFALLSVGVFAFGVFSVYYAIFAGNAGHMWGLSALASFALSVIFGGASVIAWAYGGDA